MKDIWKHIISWGKVIAVLAMVVKGALWVDARFDSSSDKLDNIQQMVDYNSIELSMQSEQIQQIQDTLEDIEKAQEANKAKIKSLTWGVKNIERFSPDDFEEIMNEMLKKNSELDFSPIVLPPRGSIPYEPTIELVEVK